MASSKNISLIDINKKFITIIYTMKRAFLSDCHAGQGEANPELRLQIQHSIERGVSYLNDCGAEIEILMGDIVHHLGNVLQAAQTRKEISLEQLGPIASMLQSQSSPTSAIAGNTDWLLSDTENPTGMRDLWLEYTGFPAEKIAFADGGLWEERVIESTDARLLITHGHVLDRAQRGDTHRPEPSEYPRLLEEMRHPSCPFIERVSSPTGAHALNSARMALIGKYVTKLPDALRRMAADGMGWLMKTRHFEPELVRLITMSGVARETRHRCYGLMGHAHIAGMRQYSDVTIVNTGSFGARNIPVQRVSDQKAHVVIVDDEEGSLTLVQTFDPRHPHRKPIPEKILDLRTGKIGGR